MRAKWRETTIAACGVGVLLCVGCTSAGPPKLAGSAQDPRSEIVAADGARRRVLDWLNLMLFLTDMNDPNDPNTPHEARCVRVPNHVFADCAHAGRTIVPDLAEYLIRYRENRRATVFQPWADPMNSTEPAQYTVRSLACHLIETAIRRDPWLAPISLGRGGTELATPAPHIDWFQRCYDPETATWKCTADDLPKTDNWRSRPHESSGIGWPWLPLPPADTADD